MGVHQQQRQDEVASDRSITPLYGVDYQVEGLVLAWDRTSSGRETHSLDSVFCPLAVLLMDSEMLLTRVGTPRPTPSRL